MDKLQENFRISRFLDAINAYLCENKSFPKIIKLHKFPLISQDGTLIASFHFQDFNENVDLFLLK